MESKKRYYKIGEIVWIVELKREGTVVAIDIEKLEVIVKWEDEVGTVEKSFKLWEIDKLKYKALKKLEVEDKDDCEPASSVKWSWSANPTYLASVNGGIIPTKDEENGGRDCYANLEPFETDEGLVHEMFLPKLQVSFIPLGFASYLNKDDVMLLNAERSSVGKFGLLNLCGLIDSTYQGEVMLMVVPLTHNILITSTVSEPEIHEDTNTILYPYKKAICQAMILKQSRAKDEHIPYDELLAKPSKRGAQGWGSSGK